MPLELLVRVLSSFYGWMSKTAELGISVNIELIFTVYTPFSSFDWYIFEIDDIEMIVDVEELI